MEIVLLPQAEEDRDYGRVASLRSIVSYILFQMERYTSMCSLCVTIINIDIILVITQHELTCNLHCRSDKYMAEEIWREREEIKND